MNKENLKFPYPVLGHVDDIDGSWGCTYSAICDDEEIRFVVEVENNFADLNELIKANRACYACEIICGRTFLRRAVCSFDDKFDIIIHRSDIRDKISLTLYIISTIDQQMYKSSKFKTVYLQSINFLQPLENGEILAILPEYNLPVDIEYDNINSTPLIEIKKEDIEFEFVKLNNDTIQVVLPVESFEKLNRIKDGFLNIYHSSFIFNAFIQAIPEIEDFSDKIWAQKLAIILQNYNLDNNKMDTTEIVQRILNNPYSRMFDSLINLNN